MKLKKLIVQGFKSFKDKTTINFDKGITGIVGPNGCGKSNIVDALFWVMGEQSAKHLRGSSMKDVIFSGSAKYAPASWAEVSLVLENDQGKHIHIGDKVYCPAEIQLTRKLYRNGETEYRINNIICRLKDIQEVFMDTGVGVKSYSIIAQGEINRLVQAGPVEKRVMIEDVAGITKFKLRKKESLKKIEQTELNLNRLIDIKTEIQRQLHVLSGQAEKAERATSLREKMQRNELVVFSHKEYDILSEFKEKKSSTFEKIQDLESSRLQKDQIDIELQQEKIKKDELQGQVELLQMQFNDVAKKLAAGEERFSMLTKSRKEKLELIEKRGKENQELQEELKGRETRLQVLDDELLQMEEQDNDLSQFDELKETVDLLRDELDFKEGSINEIKSEIDAAKEELRDLEQDQFKNAARNEELLKRLEETVAQIDVLEAELSKRIEGLTNKKIHLLDVEKKYHECEDKLQESSNELKERSVSLQSVEEQLKQETKQLFRLESKVASLEEIQNFERQGTFSGDDFLKTEEGAQNFFQFGKIFECSAIYAKALQNLFEKDLDALCSLEKDGDSFNQLWQWSSDKEGLALKVLDGQPSVIERANFQIEKANLNIVQLKDVVKLRPDFSHCHEWISYFDNYFIVDGLKSADLAMITWPEQDFRLASIDGKLVIEKVGGIVRQQVYADFDVEQGIIFRNNEIARYKEEILLLQDGVAEKEQKRSSLQEQVVALQEKLTSLQREFSELKTDYALSKSEVDNQTISSEKEKSKLEELKRKKANSSSERLVLVEKEEKVQTEVENLRASLETKLTVLEDLQETYNLKKITYNDKRDELILKQTEAKSYEQRLKSLKSQIIDVQQQIERHQARLQSNQEQVQNFQTEVAEAEQMLEQLKIDNAGGVEYLTSQEAGLIAAKRALTDLIDTIDEKEEQLKHLATKINKLDKDIVVFRTKMEQFIIDEEQIVKNIFEKYRINLRKVLASYLDIKDEELGEFANVSGMYLSETTEGMITIEEVPFQFVRHYGQDLESSKEKYRRYQRELQQLGEINWSAVEEYNRQKKRYDFLVDQEVQLKKSLDDLQGAIRQIDDKSKQRFREAFEEVNERFKRVFPILFGGGEAHLQLQGTLDDPEAGVEIIAQPPGKKMQNINLMSGGEKAMTAVSLIFSTFLVRPSPFCLLDEVDAPLDDANVTRFNEMLREMSDESQFVLITHNKKTMELNDVLYGITMQEPGISKAVSVQLQ